MLCTKTAPGIQVVLVFVIIIFHCQARSPYEIECENLTSKDGVVSWKCFAPFVYSPPIRCLYHYMKDDGDFSFFTEFEDYGYECVLQLPISVLRPGSYTFNVTMFPRRSAGAAYPQSQQSDTLVIPNDNNKSSNGSTTGATRYDDNNKSSSKDDVGPLGAVGITLMCLAIVVVIVCVVVVRARLKMTSQDLGKADDITSIQAQNTYQDPALRTVVSESQNNANIPPKNSSLPKKKRSSAEDYEIYTLPTQSHQRTGTESAQTPTSATAVISESVENHTGLSQLSEDAPEDSPKSKKRSSRDNYEIPPYPLPVYKRAESEPVQFQTPTKIVSDPGSGTSGRSKTSEKCLKSSSMPTKRSSRDNYEIPPYPLPVYKRAELEPVQFQTPTKIVSESGSCTSGRSQTSEECLKTSSMPTKKSLRDDYGIPPLYPLTDYKRPESEPVKSQPPTVIETESGSNTDGSSQTSQDSMSSLSNPENNKAPPRVLPKTHQKAAVPESDSLSRKTPHRSDYDIPPYPLRFHKEQEPVSASQDMSLNRVVKENDSASNQNNANSASNTRIINLRNPKKNTKHGNYEIPARLFLPSVAVQSCNDVSRKSEETKNSTVYMNVKLAQLRKKRNASFSIPKQHQ